MTANSDTSDGHSSIDSDFGSDFIPLRRSERKTSQVNKKMAYFSTLRARKKTRRARTTRHTNPHSVDKRRERELMHAITTVMTKLIKIKSSSSAINIDLLHSVSQIASLNLKIISSR